MVIIDLGVVSDPEPEPASSRPSTPRTRRLIAAGLCLVLAGALLGASARPVRDALPEVRLPMGPTDSFYLAGERIYLVGPETQAYGPMERTISAYTAPGGELLWQRPLMLDGPLNGITPAGDTLLLHVSSTEFQQMTVALDAATAEPRWTAQVGWPVLMDADTVVFTSEGSGGDQLAWIALRTSTGEQLWRRDFPAGAFTVYVGDPEGQLMVGLPDERIELWDLRANRRLAEARTPESSAVSVTNGVVLTGIPGTGLTDVVAYSRPDLRRLWQREVLGGIGQVGCGEQVLCVGTEMQDRTLGLDPATGEQLWESPAYGWYTESGSLLLAEGQIQREGGSTFIDSGPIVALDGRTGRTIKDFGSWRRLRWGPDMSEQRIVAAHFDAVAGTALVAEIDLDALSLRVLGRIDGVGPDCFAERDVLVCRSLDGSVGMWDLPVR
ncbi:outer membrane protein assembly factor BamB [Catenuloplanes nepalensis]|uniref:Outer membrane protein assembly factor BamB n=1 Tax=Catenuloplanes nepalensis TaxID=587533 RepID=A0ABT9MZR9_9ACTN|nr:PQQ-binding-like beta-propeller repeat protein [Catenuloplanes nepalensis]MDP9796943.1 outer membrane protein assembly factor BamB [Catenuloplanes nepalensis]